MKTIKLYDLDSHLSQFDATVVKCEKNDNGYSVILDRTAFFPEGGGQPADTGKIGDASVSDVQIENGIITHFTDAPAEGSVHCQLDWKQRFRRMQNHSGEHIVSGIAHNLYGCTNVGFHMGEEITVDFDRELNEEQLEIIERTANEAIYKNVNVKAEYPKPEILETLDYRSKLELTEDVRIVTVEGYDRCACCAPHVSKTGEIGIIKILSSMRHRGGIRIRILCGEDAFDDYRIKCKNLYEIAVALCAKQNEAAASFRKFADETAELKLRVSKLTKELTHYKAQNLDSGSGNILIFEDELAMPELRSLVLESAKHCEGICAGFSGRDGAYIYAISSTGVKLRSMAKEINAALNGKGGGSDELLQGSVCADRKTIEKYFNS